MHVFATSTLTIGDKNTSILVTKIYCVWFGTENL